MCKKNNSFLPIAKKTLQTWVLVMNALFSVSSKNWLKHPTRVLTVPGVVAQNKFLLFPLSPVNGNSLGFQHDL